MKKIRTFVDSDVIISSIISQKGAAYFLLENLEASYYVSDVSVKELKKVVKRLGLDIEKLDKQIKKLRISKLKPYKKDMQEYVLDTDDTHIIAGALSSKAKFLITYNIRHFKLEKIKRDFKINVLTPAQFLQYLRSQ